MAQQLRLNLRIKEQATEIVRSFVKINIHTIPWRWGNQMTGVQTVEAVVLVSVNDVALFGRLMATSSNVSSSAVDMILLSPS